VGGGGLGVGGVGPTPKPPIPNPQSPIPNPQLKPLKNIISINYLNFYQFFKNK